MSVLFTIELRVDCGHDKKYGLAKQVIKQVALQAYARVALLDNGPKEARRPVLRVIQGGRPRRTRTASGR